MPQGDRAALYDRISNETQIDNFSIETQQQKQYGSCDTKGYIIEPEHIYEEVEKGLDTYRDRKI